MSRLWPEGEPIRMQVDGEGRPVIFYWQGRRHRLARIHQRWQIDTDWWRAEGRIWRAYFAVTTVTGIFCVIFQDLLLDKWFLAKIYD